MGLRRSADCRYEGQSFELTVPVTDGPIDAGALAALAEAFGREHQRTYGHRAGAEEPVEIVNLRVVAHGVSDRPRVPERLRVDRPGAARPAAPGGCTSAPASAGARRRSSIARRSPRPGSARASIEEYDATCVVPPGARATLDAYGNIAIELGREI